MKVFDIYKTIENTSKWAEDTEKLMHSYDSTLKKIKHAHPELYRDIKCNIYTLIYGWHFNEYMLEKAYKCMVNDNGTPVPKWTVEETTSVAGSNGIPFDDFNKYDWNYVMNMLYSDYYAILGDSVSNYVNMAKKFLYDKDAPEGKALKYYYAMKD